MPHMNMSHGDDTNGSELVDFDDFANPPQKCYVQDHHGRGGKTRHDSTQCIRRNMILTMRMEIHVHAVPTEKLLI